MMMLGSALILSLSLLAATGTDIKFVASDAPAGASISLHRITVEGEENPALFATITRAGSQLTLTPAFALSPGEDYEARVTLDGKIINQMVHHHPAPDSKAPQVVKILPNTGTVPANLLKFYLEFDQPMREGLEIFDRIHLVDDAGTEVDSPWRREELWSADGKRLTLWIHPGRIKQGVNLREQLGPVLLPGRKYELVLDGSIQTPAGQTLGQSIRQSFETTAENRTILDLTAWKITPPNSPISPLIIETPRALDPFLAARYLRIFRLDDQVETKMEWGQSQSRFEFHPGSEWISGAYRIEVGEFLEDLAGNTPVRIFDTDLSAAPPQKSSLQRQFSIK